MSDSEEKPESSSTAASIPSWQKQSDTTEKPADEETSSTNGQTADAPSGDDTDKLEVARRFLSDEKVKDAPRQQKVEFLTNKGIDPEDIELLLGPDDQQVAATTTTNVGSSLVLETIEETFCLQKYPNSHNQPTTCKHARVQQQKKQQR